MSDRESTSTSSSAAERDRPMDCVSALRQLWDYLDGELTPDRVAAIRRHIEICSSCFPHYDFEKAFLDALAATKPECCAPERLKERVEAALKDAGFSGRCQWERKD